MTFATDMQAVASELVEEFGTTAVFTVLASRSTGTDGTVTETDPVTHTAKISLATPDKSLGSDTTDRRGEDVWILPALGLTWTPSRGMLVTILSESWRITKVTPVVPQDTVVHYRVMVEGV